MLELHNLTVQSGKPPHERFLLTEINASFPTAGHFAAILGAEDCGKSTLLKVIAGLRAQALGWIVWEGRDLSKDGDFAPHEIGYVPPFDFAHELLTVWESIETALRLRVSGLDRYEVRARLAQILHDTGLEEVANRQVRILSRGQKRQLALALEMVSAPRLLLCHEVTSGLDPKAEEEIVRLLRRLSRQNDRLVLNATPSLRHLALYDSVLVLHEGHVAFHGSPEFLFHYFGVERHEDFFPQLARREVQQWQRSWQKHRATYYAQSRLTGNASADPHIGEEGFGIPGSEARKARVKLMIEQLEREKAEAARRAGAVPPTPIALVPPAVALAPSAWTQFGVLLVRRVRLFVRDRSQLGLQLALLFGAPCLVVIFALDRLPQLKCFSQTDAGNALQQMQVGSFVSGLVMLQVILVALIGSHKAAREIAGERLIFEKEKFAGLRPFAYVASKAFFLGTLVLAQAAWMAIFVHEIVRLPGDLSVQLGFLALVNAALTAVCLGISSFARNSEQAALTSICLVGFQLPLSGVVLALPAAVDAFVRPFIASYWGWSGFIQSMRDTRFYEAVLQVSPTRLSPVALCAWLLVSHVVAGLGIAWIGSRRARWE